MNADARADGRSLNQLRPLACTRNVLHRAHGSARWSQGDTIVLAAVFGPKAGTKKGENPEKAYIEVIWKPKTGQIGRQEREYEMVLRKTLQSVCLLTVHPNTTTSVIVQVIGDDGANMNAVLQLVFPNPPLSIHQKPQSQLEDEPIEHGIITSVTRGVISVLDYERCMERGSAACAKISEFTRRHLELSATNLSS